MKRVLAVLFLIIVNIPITINAAEQPFLTLPLPSQATAANGWNYRIKDDPHTKTLLHAAIDYYVDIGTPVVVAADGYAMFDCQTCKSKNVCNNYCTGGDEYGYGRLIIIRHDEKNTEGEFFYSLYAHLQDSEDFIPKKSRHTAEDSTDVKANGWVKVKRGQKIGEVGYSGGQTWQHLHFAVFTGSYDSMCHPERKINCKNNTYDPYDLYKPTIIKEQEESYSYYPPIIYLNPDDNKISTTLNKPKSNTPNTRYSGSNYNSSGQNRLWVTDPPFPPVFVHPIGDKSSGTLRLQGLNFGDNKGKVRINYESDSLNATQVEILTPTAIQWTDTEIQIELFNLNGLDWDSFNTPILVELFKQNGEKISEFWYPFVDVPIDTYYSKPATQLWKKNNILKGTSKGEYRFLLPNEGDTRAEFLKKLVEAWYKDHVEVTLYLDSYTQKPIACAIPDFPECQIPPFTDVWPDHKWAYQHMIIAHNLGWFNNDESTVNTTFNPNNVITRAEAAKWLIKAKNLSDFEYIYHKYPSFLMEPHFFSDVPSSAWYFDYVYIARSLGIFDGFDDGRFRPNEVLRKGQAAKVIYNFMKNN